MVQLSGVVRFPWKRTPAIRPSRKAITGEIKRRKARKAVKKKRPVRKKRTGAGLKIGGGLRIGRGMKVGGRIRRRRRRGKGMSL